MWHTNPVTSISAVANRDDSLALALASGSNCSVARALDVLGDPWAFLVLREPFFRVRRFDDILHNLGTARNVLSARLVSLVEGGLLEKQPYSQRPPRFEYRLTDAGLDLYPALIALLEWGDKWKADANGPPIFLRHLNCGHRLHGRLACSECCETVHPKQVSPEPGVSFSAAPGAQAPVMSTRRRVDVGLYTRSRECSVARALTVIGDRWSYQIIRAAFFNVRRFDEFQQALAIARNILAARLQLLVDEGVFERRLYQERPERYEYVLTRKGRDFYPSCLMLIAWGDRWRSGGRGPPLDLRHKGCGKVFTPQLVCAACNDPIRARDVEVEPTKAAPRH
jgi:DNA-binding HxlR family transcriptional regulator